MCAGQAFARRVIDEGVMTHGQPQHFEWYENFYYTQDSPVLYTGGMYQEFNRVLLTILTNGDADAALSPKSVEE